MTTRKQADQAQKAIPATAHKTTRKSTGTKLQQKTLLPKVLQQNLKHRERLPVLQLPERMQETPV